MPTHVLPVVQCDRDDPGVIIRVTNPVGLPTVIADRGFYRIAMSHDGSASWIIDAIPTISTGCIIGANDSQVIYLPRDGMSIAALLLPNPTNPTGELSINKLKVWEMPGNNPSTYTLYPTQ